MKYRLPGGKTKKKQERHHLHPNIRECRGQNILLLYLKKITTQKLKQHRSSEYFSAIRFIRIDLPFSVLPYIPACRHHPLPEAGSIWTEIQRTICSASQSACSSRSSSRLIHTQKAFTCTWALMAHDRLIFTSCSCTVQMFLFFSFKTGQSSFPSIYEHKQTKTSLLWGIINWTHTWY